MSAEEAEVEFGAGDLVPGDVRPELWSGRVNVQLLDLASAAVASAKPGKDLRLLANLDIGGSRVNLNPDHTVLPGNRIAGHVRHGDGRWKNNELYLMSFAVEDGRKLWHYDVFVEHKSASIRN